MEDDRSVPAVFVCAVKGAPCTGRTVFDSGRLSTEGIDQVSSMKELRGGRTRRKTLVIDSTSLSERSFNPPVIERIKISGSDIWLLETVRNMDDMMDAFLGGITKLVIPVHTMGRGFTLDDVVSASDSCVPAVLCSRGMTMAGGNVLETVRSISREDFPNVLVMDCDGSVDDSVWSVLMSDDPGLWVFSPARTSAQIESSNVVFRTVGTYETNPSN